MMQNGKMALVFAGLLCLSSTAGAVERVSESWYTTVKMGVFYPAAADWKVYYGDDFTPSFSVGLHYSPLPFFSIGGEVGVAQDKGKGVAVANGTLAGEAEIDLYPASLELTLFGRRREHQTIVPYLSAGVLRVGYRGEASGNPDVIKGSADGWLMRAGLQWRLNDLDLGTARVARENYGIDQTYLLLEYSRHQADKDTEAGSVDLGGESLVLGVGIRF